MNTRALTAGLVIAIASHSAAAQVFTATNEPGLPVKSIDPATGQVQTVVTTGLPTAAGQGVSAFDVSGRRLFFLSFSGVNEPSLAIVNVDTHAVTTRPLPSIGSLAYFLFEFGAALSVAVPAAQPLSLGFMTAGLLLVAAWFLRRAAIDPR